MNLLIILNINSYFGEFKIKELTEKGFYQVCMKFKELARIYLHSKTLNREVEYIDDILLKFNIL